MMPQQRAGTHGKRIPSLACPPGYHPPAPSPGGANVVATPLSGAPLCAAAGLLLLRVLLFWRGGPRGSQTRCRFGFAAAAPACDARRSERDEGAAFRAFLAALAHICKHAPRGGHCSSRHVVRGCGHRRKGVVRGERDHRGGGGRTPAWAHMPCMAPNPFSTSDFSLGWGES